MRANRLLHLADRWVGIPLVFILGLFHRKKPLPTLQGTIRIALLNTAAIGDTILISGIVADLRKKYPNAQITFFVGPSNFQAAQLIDGIAVVKIEVTKIYQTIQKIRKTSFDAWIDFGQWPRINAIYSHFAKADFKIGFQTERQYRHYIYDKVVSHQYIHELGNFRNLLECLGIKGEHTPKIQLSKIILKNEKQIVLHLYPGGSRADLKKWPESSWIELSNALTQKGYQLYLTGSFADQASCEKLQRACNDPNSIHVVAGLLSLEKTAELLLSSCCTISVDTGIMHLSAALGCLTIALHGPTSFFRWGGIGEQVIPIQQVQGYCPCLHLGFEKKCQTSRCMAAIHPKQVLETLFSKIEKK